MQIANPMDKEQHPLQPFLPEGAKILMLGSFPPPKKRWCMDYGDKNFFVVPGEKRFDKDKITAFCRTQGIALYDTAEEVVRLKGNASDNFLQVERPTDLAALLERIPDCHTIVATGQKSAETLQAITGCAPLPVGGCIKTDFAGRRVAVWRMPSSSRAYPRPVEWKAAFYQKILETL